MPQASSLIEAMQQSMAASLRVPDGVAEPAALLWTDADGQWKSLVPALLKMLPQLFVLGTYSPEERRGPVIWLKCIVDRSLPDISPSPREIPILYLPRVSRQDLRAGADCPIHLRPLIELQFRGAVWHQRNGRDWTVEAFLTSEQGLGLDVAMDNRTRDAMLRALPLIALEPIGRLRGRRLEADDFDRLAIVDPVRDLLAWMSEAETFQARCDADRWATFCDVCAREFAFDPDRSGTQAAADALLQGGGKWDEVWRRFCDAPQLYPGISAVLRRARSRDLLGLADHSRRPGLNEEQENKLRKALEDVLSVPHAQACDAIITLDEQHKERRGWVWAQLGESPYAMALEPLGKLARATRTALGGTSIESMAADYATQGWKCDRAAIEALSQIKSKDDNSVVTKVVRALYEPWLDRSARRFQELMSAPGVDATKLPSGVSAECESCVLFVDGLRYDLGAVLQEKLEARGFRTKLSHRIAPIPTVTPTAKPLASPVHEGISGSSDAEQFCPIITSSKQPVTAQRLRDAMARQGVEVLDSDESRMALGAEVGGWVETGNLDSLGHSLDLLLVRHIGVQLDTIIDRISGLLSAGWSRVRVVTDHGWLLLPGGLPKVVLPPYLVETKWARCAAVKGDATPSMPVYPWYWNPHLRIASPPGISAFFAGTSYAHGGVSPQECVIPDLIVERGEQAVTGEIIEVSWRGMRCRVAAKANSPEVLVDLRLNWKQPATSIVAAVKKLGLDGETSLAVPDDRHEGAAASVVLVDASGRVLASETTTVGEAT